MAAPYWRARVGAPVLGSADMRADIASVLSAFLPAAGFYLTTSLVFYLAVQNLAAFSSWQLARLGWCFGFGQFASGMAWIGEAFLVEAELFLWALPFAVTGLPAGLACFMLPLLRCSGRLAKGFLLTQMRAFVLLALLDAQRICA